MFDVGQMTGTWTRAISLFDHGTRQGHQSPGAGGGGELGEKFTTGHSVDCVAAHRAPFPEGLWPAFPDHGIVTTAISHNTPIGVSWSFYLSSFGVCSNNSSGSRSLRVI
jgi:hypothetical protein